MNRSLETLDAEARAVLLGNDRGGYTIPTSGLYPYQWNWDSVFVALGFMVFDEPRAWSEIESLFEAQWPNGMVPHIVFRRDDPDYFPGPSVWGTKQLGHPWPTSGISQPPVAATAIRRMVETAQDKPGAIERVRSLLPKLAALHRWWHAARDPDGLGIMAVSHPWESGRDNLPDWDRPGDAIDISTVGAYTRRDTSHIGTDMRPTKRDYDRYLALVQFGKDCDWDTETIAEQSPFWVADVGVTAILLRAERDLLALSEQSGETAISADTQIRIQRMQSGFGRLWNEAAGAFCSLDLRTHRHADVANAATLLCFYADAGTAEQRGRQVELAKSWAARVRYMCPSYDPSDAAFDAMRYWRGPVWAIINFMIGSGFEEAGETALATRIHDDTQQLMELGGFAESYSALDGQPTGGGIFSWSAAIWLAWISPSL